MLCEFERREDGRKRIVCSSYWGHEDHLFPQWDEKWTGEDSEHSDSIFD